MFRSLFVLFFILFSSQVKATDIVQVNALFFDVDKPQKIGENMYKISFGSEPTRTFWDATIDCTRKTVGFMEGGSYSVYGVDKVPSISRLLDKVCNRPWYKF